VMPSKCFCGSGLRDEKSMFWGLQIVSTWRMGANLRTYRLMTSQATGSGQPRLDSRAAF
jgi:hypothetical protein